MLKVATSCDVAIVSKKSWLYDYALTPSKIIHFNRKIYGKKNVFDLSSIEKVSMAILNSFRKKEGLHTFLEMGLALNLFFI